MTDTIQAAGEAEHAMLAEPAQGAPCHTGERAWPAQALTAAVLLAGLPLTSRFPSFWLHGFCLPAARLSATFLGMPCVAADDGYVLANDSLPVLVTRACSAAHLFILTLALLIGAAWRPAPGSAFPWRWSRRRASDPAARSRLSPLLRLAWLVAVGYAITVVANTARIVIGWFASVWARRFLPPWQWAGVHTAVGVLVFLMFLVAAYTFAIGRRTHEARHG